MSRAALTLAVLTLLHATLACWALSSLWPRQPRRPAPPCDPPPARSRRKTAAAPASRSALG